MARKFIFFFLVICMSISVLSSSNSHGNEVNASNNLLVHNLDTGLNYTTIQEAISALETLDGHTIFVEQGIYNGHINVHKALSIIGEDKETTIIDGSNLGYGIYITASNVNITGFTIQNCSPAQSGHGVIIDNTYYYVKKSVCNRINGNIIKNNVRGIFFHNSSMNTISENLIVNNTEGIYLEDYSGYNTISKNYLKNNTKGIWADYKCTHNIISNNTLYSSPVAMLAFAHYSRFNDNLLFDNGYLFLDRSNYSTVYQNTMTKGWGISVTGNHNIIYENTITKSYTGLIVGGSNITLFNNTLTENELNFGVTSGSYDNSIDKSNMVDGKPIYYIKHEDNLVIDSLTNAGTIYLVHCKNITVRDLTLSRNYFGVFLYKSNQCRIENITMINFSYGIMLRNSNRNIIQEIVAIANFRMSECIEVEVSEYNIIRRNNLRNGSCGLTIGYWANHNVIQKNNFTENTIGLRLSSSSNNTITENYIQNNKLYGISISHSTNNTIYHNSFINNTCRVENWIGYPMPPNTWDMGYPLGGNYWNDFEERYPNATELNDSGIWDTPYVIEENNQDNYPLIPEFSSLFFLPLLLLATSLATWVYKKKKKG